MTDRSAAFQGTIHSFKTIPSRSVVSITVEVDIGQLADVARIAEHGAWVAVARLQATKEETKALPAPKRDWHEMQPQQQAGIRCGEATFIAFLKETRPDDWHESQDAAECVRLICGVSSRVELGINRSAKAIWERLDKEYDAWLAKERVRA
jgi:hypothetical protein